MLYNKFIIFILLLTLFTGCPMPPDNSNFPQNGNISAENPTNLRYSEDINNNINIYWDGNINNGSYAVGYTDINVKPTSISQINNIQFVSVNNSYSITINEDQHYYFWIIPTIINDNDKNKITNEELNLSQSIYYRKDSESQNSNTEVPSFSIYIESQANMSQFIKVSNNEDVIADKIIIKGDNLEENTISYYSFKLNENDWSSDNSFDDAFYYTVLNNEYGNIQIKARYSDGSYGDIIQLNLSEKKELENVSIKDSFNNEIHVDQTYNSDIKIQASKPDGYTSHGEFKILLNDSSSWQTFSDNENGIHIIEVEEGEEYSISSIKIKYEVSPVYSSIIHTFKDNNFTLSFKIDKKPPLHNFTSILSKPYTLEVNWKKPLDIDLNNVKIEYSTNSGTSYSLFNEYSSDSIPSEKTEYISIDSPLVNLRLTYKDSIGNISFYEEKDILVTTNLTHLCVTQNGDSTNVGSTWETATELQRAIEFAHQHNIKEVWVQKGTYYPKSHPNTSSAPNGSVYHFSLRNNVRVIGGFDGNEDQIPDTFDITDSNQTILFPFSDAFNTSYHIFYHPSGTALNNTAILERVVLKDGEAIGTYTNDDRNHVQTASGGAIYSQYSSPVFINCKFINNLAKKSGGAVYLANSTSKFINCIFDSNSITHSSSSPYVNIAYIYGGGAIYAINSNIELTNCIFNNNTATSFGSALTLDGISTLLSTNTTFYNNNLFNDKSEKIIFVYNLPINTNNIFNNTIIDSSKIYYNENAGGDLSQFTIINNSSSENGTLINSGNNSYLPKDTFDIDHDNNTSEVIPFDCYNNPRINDNTVDIGHFESN